MRFALAGLALLMNALDNFTTFSCLYHPVDGFEVYEANSVAKWGFETFGLLQGLVFEMLLTTAAVAFLVYSRSFSLPLRMSILIAMVSLSAWATVNNALVMHALGIGLPF